MKKVLVRRYLPFFIIAAITGVADLWTKSWVEHSTSIPQFPLSHVVTDAEAGKPLGEVVKTAFPFLGDDETAAFEVGSFVQGASPSTLVYDAEGPLFDTYRDKTCLYVYKNGPDIKPRCLVLNDDQKLVKWIKRVKPAMTTKEIHAKVADYLGSLTLHQFVTANEPALDEADVDGVIANGVVAVSQSGLGKDSAYAPKAGEVLLLKERHVEVISGFIYFVYARNPNAAWGFLSSVPEGIRMMFLNIFHIIAMIVVLFFIYYQEPESMIATISFGLIFGGAVGNLVDRLQLGFVIDWIDMYIGDLYKWPTYNVADIAIVVGVGLLMLMMIFQKKPAEAPKKGRSKA